MKTIKLFGLALAAIVMLPHVPAAIAQQAKYGNRKVACGCYMCGTLLWVHFGEPDCAGILAEDACGGMVGNLPQEKRAGFCQKLTKKFGSASFNGKCRAYAPYCGPGATAAQSPASGGTATPGQFPPVEGTWGKGMPTNTPGQFPPVDGSWGKGTKANTPQ